MDLGNLRDFNLVASHGGLGLASRASGLPKATLSRHVSQLEEELGVRLIERGTQGLRLTEEGRVLHERTRGLLADIAEVGEAVVSGGSVPRGLLRVSAPVVLSHVVLGYVAAAYARAWPDVQLEIVAEDRRVDPIEDGFDLVIRIDPAADEWLVGRRFLLDQRILVAHPDAPRPVVEKGEAGVAVVSLTSRPLQAYWDIRGRGDEAADTETWRAVPRSVLKLSSFLMVRDAVIYGAGAALLPRLLVANDLQAGRLVSWGLHAAAPVEIWALHSSRRLASAKVRAFLDLLQATFPGRHFDPSTASSFGVALHGPT